jgi:hypothetical protein
LYLPAEFAKSALGLTLLLAFVWSLSAAKGVRGLVLIGVLFVLLALSHKLAAALGLVFVFSRREDVPVWTLVLAAVLLLILAAWQRDLLMNLFGAPSWSLPVQALGGHELRFGGDVYLALAAAVLALVRWRKTSKQSLVAAVMIVVIAQPWLDVSDPEGLGYRLRLALFALTAICAPEVVGAISNRFRTGALWGVMLALLLLRPHEPRDGVVWAHPRLNLAAQNAASMIPRDQVAVVPDRQLMFMLAWHGVDNAVLRGDDVATGRRVRVIPMAVMSPEFLGALARARELLPPELPPIRSAHPDHPDGLVVMDEATWEWVQKNRR